MSDVFQLRTRPRPPPALLDGSDVRVFGQFIPAPELEAWVRAVFIEEGAPLHNPEHWHLQGARIGFLWTDVPNGRNQRAIVGQAELGKPQVNGRWMKARAEMQIEQWFGSAPTFLITLDANHVAACDDAAFCALIEHELYHCSYERDEFNAPKFRKDGSIAYAIRGHDVEEFVGVVRRYGADATGVRAMVDAAQRPAEIALARISGVCGTCRKDAA